MREEKNKKASWESSLSVGSVGVSIKDQSGNLNRARERNGKRDFIIMFHRMDYY